MTIVRSQSSGVPDDAAGKPRRRSYLESYTGSGYELTRARLSKGEPNRENYNPIAIARAGRERLRPGIEQVRGYDHVPSSGRAARDHQSDGAARREKLAVALPSRRHDQRTQRRRRKNLRCRVRRRAARQLEQSLPVSGRQQLLDGLVRPPLGAAASGGSVALARGFAVATSDTGHQGEGRSYDVDQQASRWISRKSRSRRSRESPNRSSPATYGQDARCSVTARAAPRAAAKRCS